MWGDIRTWLPLHGSLCDGLQFGNRLIVGGSCAAQQCELAHLTYSNAMACSSSTSRRRAAPRALQAGSRVRHGSGAIYQPADIQRMLEPSSGGTALAALHSLQNVWHRHGVRDRERGARAPPRADASIAPLLGVVLCVWRLPGFGPRGLPYACIAVGCVITVNWPPGFRRRWSYKCGSSSRSFATARTLRRG